MTRIEQPHHSIRWRRGEPSIEWGNAQSPRRSLELRRAARVRPRGRRQRTVLCHTSHARDAFHIVHHHPPSSSLAGFPVWPRPTVPRGCAGPPGSGACPSHQSRDRSVPAPRTVRLVHLPAFLAAVLIIQQIFITHSVAARPRAPAAAREGRAPGPWMGLGYWGEPTRGGHGPRPTSRALVPPAAPARTTPGRAEGRGRRGALGPSTCRGPDRAGRS
jgi:hypothetical protein